ncbi:universal stress protein [Paenibacillus qinlingensis]|uniref:Nucleotide-binding universal stress UspA family protein n=1 Tax=Paenibacillus qinlingensis TaxID=1837343 RepID=A0ABU1NSC6_9BACL|nr:universal stress protein [Paenibacillus qinlingensis]MDR6550349.1 nucleotide-binding universal stress UspA family protein [Paenibacillus qinlingensis]
MNISNILVAYDGSEPAEKALTHAIDMAQHYPEAKLTVLTVYNLSPDIALDVALTVPVLEQESELLHLEQDLLKEARRRIQILPSAETVMLEGSPGETIVNYAKDHSCDLIIAGSRGLGALREFVLGSVSHFILKHSDVPLLVIK